MTYGPVQKWSIPLLYNKLLDSRRPATRVLLVFLLVLGCALLSYWACRFPSSTVLLKGSNTGSDQTGNYRTKLRHDVDKTEGELLRDKLDPPQAALRPQDTLRRDGPDTTTWESESDDLDVDQPHTTTAVDDLEPTKTTLKSGELEQTQSILKGDANLQTNGILRNNALADTVTQARVDSFENIDTKRDLNVIPRAPARVPSAQSGHEKGVSNIELRPTDKNSQYDSQDEYASGEKAGEAFNLSSAVAEKTEISWDDPRLDILHMPKPEFNPKFQNPCWYEPLRGPDPYKNNSYVLYSPSARDTLDQLTDRWEELYDTEEEPRRLRCLPYFMIIGQPKCGSTDLFWKVSKHPDVATPPIKELHWWARNRQGRRFNYKRIIPLEDYVDMFDRAAVRIEEHALNQSYPSLQAAPPYSQTITGEASVSVLWDNNNWQQLPENQDATGPGGEPLYVNPHYVRHLIPDVKLIVILRDPVERMYSDYLYFHKTDSSLSDFHTAVQYAISCYSNCTRQHSLRHCVYSLAVTNRARIRLRVGMYSVFLQDWFSVFPRHQFYILRLEDYSQDSLKYIKEIYKFLKIREISVEEEELILDSPISNVRKAGDRELGGMLAETRRLLEDFYTPFNQELARMMGDKRYLWND